MQPRAFGKSVDHTLAFIRDLDHARNLADLSFRVMRHVAQFGVEHVVAVTFPNPGECRRQQLGHVLLSNWPAEWSQHYLSRNYAFTDPIIRRAQSCVGHPFFWRELAPMIAANPAARRVMNEATEFHLKEGFSAALVTLEGEPICFSLGGRHLEVTDKTAGMMLVIANSAIRRAISLVQDAHASEPVILSQREREALQWASEGKGDSEIGEAMNISEHGADKHMRSVRAKLGAINRTQAVAEAIRRGLIT